MSWCRGASVSYAHLDVYKRQYQVFFAQTPNYLLFGLIGLICSLAGQIGDLSLSLIKRNFGIKDYGTIMPGHGGVLDRFDSVLFAAPMCEALLFLLPSLL